MENVYGQIIRVVLALIAIVAFMLILYRYAGKLKFSLNLKQKTTPYSLRKLDMIHLGYKKFVSVVEIKDQILVIGMGEKELSLLARWTKEENEK
jgi:flagellar biogenesis protein FliO